MKFAAGDSSSEGTDKSYPNVLGGVQGATTRFPIHPNLFRTTVRSLLLDGGQRLGRYRVLPRLAPDVLCRMLQTEKEFRQLLLVVVHNGITSR